MAHTLQERYSSLVLTKLRKELVLKDGIVFNNDYEGNPTAGAVKIPQRDTEVTAGDYSTTAGIDLSTGSTSYLTVTINKDKAVNEIIDGYEAEAVPDNLAADRLDSAAYSLASVIDNDGATELLTGGTPLNYEQITKDNAYSAMVDVRTAMSKANVPNDGRRYALVTPDFFALLLKSPEFISASNLGDAVKQSGAIGSIAGFNLYEWNDNTAGLQAICGHPRFATRVNEWKVPVSINTLNNTFIGASAVQGRMVYAHKVLRSAAIRLLMSPASLTVTLAAGSGGAGKTAVSATGGGDGATYKYRILGDNPRAVYGQGTTGFTAVSTEAEPTVGDTIEVAQFSSSKVVAVGYATVTAEDIAAS